MGGCGNSWREPIWSKSIRIGLAGLIAATGIVIAGGTLGVYGTRGVYEVYSSKIYNGKTISVKKQDNRLNIDSYYVLIDNRDKITQGKFVTEDNKIVELCNNWRDYSIKDYKR